MLFVTVGNATQPFIRLLRAIDELKTAGEISGHVVLQVGRASSFRPQSCEYHDVVPYERFTELIAEADVIVSHAGAGTLTHVMGIGKTPVVMPRRAKYGEHVDDHQLELAEALERQDRVIVAREAVDLVPAIARARQCERVSGGHRAPLIDLVSSALAEVVKKGG